MELRILTSLFICLGIASLIGCGGSSDGSSNGGIIFEGQLIEGVGVADERAVAQYRHGKDEPIEDVEICALGECSITDGTGNFGFRASETFISGPALFTVKGHYTDASIVVDIPKGAQEVFVHLARINEGQVELHHLEVNGERVSDHDHDHQ